MEFEFEVIRLWEIPADDLLRSALATVPLAVLGKLPEVLRLEDALADVIKRLAQRLQQEAARQQAERLLTAAYILTGLRLPKPEDVAQLFRGVSVTMRESVTYQAILEEGRVEGRVEGGATVLLKQLTKRWGSLSEELQQQIRRLPLDQLAGLGEALLDFDSVQDLEAWLEANS